MIKYAEASIKDISSILTELNSSPQGLSHSEAKNKLKTHGSNKPESYRTKLSSILFKQFKSPFVILLIIASIISFAIGETTNAVIIGLFVIINTGLGLFHEARAQKAATLLKKKIPSKTTVLRSNKKITIDKQFLVTGDIVFLQQWDIAPADLRVMQAENLMVNESMLSGEAKHVTKTTDPLKREATSVFNAKNILFAGSTITTGQAVGIVISTGKDTVLGEISQLVTTISPESNYGKRLRLFYHSILKVVLVSIALIFIAYMLIKGPGHFTEFTIFIIALLVGIVPEALPTVATFSLSLGALKLAKKNVIVKRLGAIEDLGDIEILCTDKTGTLTENILVLENIISEDPQKCLLLGCLCAKELKTSFDLALEKKATPKITKETREFKSIAITPFDSFRMRSSTVVEHTSGKQFLIAMGAPEKIIEISSNINADRKKALNDQLKKEGQAGKRTLAIAFKECNLKIPSSCEESHATYVGFFSFTDPLKKQSKPAIEAARRLGLTVKILTGDNAAVAEAIGKEVGLISGSAEVVSGDDLEKLSRSDFQKACELFSVFTRVSPKIKHKIIHVLQKKYSVGFLGDGINDAPALKLAHVGISVKGAVDVAREASDIILLRKDLMALVEGIREGRKVFANINKFIACTLISNFGNCYSMALVSLALPFIPILPIQILLVNLLSDLPLVAIATDSVDADELKKPKQYYISHLIPLIIILAFVSSIFDLLFFGLFFSSENPTSLRTKWFVMSIATEILLIYSIRTRLLFVRAKAPSTWLITTSMVALGITITLPFTAVGQKFFSLQFSTTRQGITLFIGLMLGYFVVTEFVKLLYFKLKSRNQATQPH